MKRKLLTWVIMMTMLFAMLPAIPTPALAAGDTGVEFRLVDNTDGSYKLVFSAKTPTTIEAFNAVFSYDKNIVQPVWAAVHTTDFVLTADSETVIALTNLPFTRLLKTPDLYGGAIPGELFTMEQTLWRETTNREAFLVAMHKGGDKADSDGTYQDLFEFYFRINSGYDETSIGATTFKFGDFVDGTDTIFDEYFPDPPNIRVGIELTENAINGDVYHWGYGASTTATYPDDIDEVNNLTFSTAALTGSATISNTAPRIGDTLTGAYTPGNNSGTLSYQWKAGGVNVGTDSTSYTVVIADVGKSITLEITSDVESGTVTSAATAAVLKKAGPAAPTAPTLDASSTYDTITLTANAAYEFSKDGTTWQTGNVFSGLTPSTVYSFYQRVAETTDTEASAASPALSETTLATFPEAPGSFTATPGNEQVVLTWTTPYNGGSAITKYQISYDETTGYATSWGDITGSGPSTVTYTVTGLTNGTNYTFEVRAVNAIDNGASASATATPVAKPTQSGFGFGSASLTKTYGDALFTETPTGQATGSTIGNWTSSDPLVATISATGQVTILKTGATTISATASETSAYAATVASYSLLVEPKTVTVTAGTYTVTKVYDGTAAAGTADGALSVSGILTADTGVTVVAVPDAYSASAPNSYTVTVNLSISGDTDGNYVLSAATITVPGSITKNPLSNVTIAAIADQPYTGSPLTPIPAVTDGLLVLSAPVDYTLSYTDNIAVGTATVTLTATGTGNYSGTASATFAIIKGAAPSATTPAAIMVKADRTGSFDLDTIALNKTGAGARSYTLGAFTDGDGILTGAPALSGSMLSFTGESGVSVGDDDATLVVTVETANYADCTVTLTFEVTDNEIVSLSGISVADKTYDATDAAYAGTLTATDEDSLDVTSVVTPVYTYSGAPNVGAFTSGATPPTEAGAYLLTVTGTGTGMVVTPLSIPFTIDRKTVTITGVNQSVRVGVAPSAFTATIAGEVDGYGLTTPVTTADCPAYVDVAGQYPIIPDPSDDTSGNYNIIYVNGVLSVTSGGGSSNNDDNGSSGGGGGGGAATTTVPAGDGTVSVGYSKAGAALTLELPSAKLDEIIAKAADGVAKFDVSKVADVTSVAMPKAALSKIAGAGYGVEIKFPQASILLDADAADSIAAQTNGTNLSIEYKELKVSDLSPSQREAVRGSDIIVDINIYTGTQKITSFDGTLTVTVSYNGPVPAAVWYLNDNGDLEKIDCVYDAATNTVTFTIDHLSVYIIGLDDSATDTEDGAAAELFRDVNAADWFYNAVMWVFDNGLMNGTSTDLFSPNASLTRGMVVTVLYRMEGSPSVAGLANPFSDVTAGTWYTDAVAWAANNDIVNGMSETIFAPEDNITREQMAAILYRYAVFTGNGPEGAWAINLDFADAYQISDWATDGAMFCSMKGIITGKPGNLFDPKGNATRAEYATMLMRFAGAN